MVMKDENTNNLYNVENEKCRETYEIVRKEQLVSPGLQSKNGKKLHRGHGICRSGTEILDAEPGREHFMWQKQLEKEDMKDSRWIILEEK